jgi:hypothetical protein
MRMPRATAAGISFRDAVGRACIATALAMLAYAFLMLQSWGHEVAAAPAPGAAFPPVRRVSLPACQRQVLVGRFQDLVLWLMETEHVQAFRPRRN